MHKVGDTVYADFSTYGRFAADQGVVTKVTPSGRITAEFGTRGLSRFNRNGMEIGAGLHAARLLPNVAAYEVLKGQQKAQRLVSEYVTQARDCPRFKNKACMLEHLSALTELATQIPDDWEA